MNPKRVSALFTFLLGQAYLGFWYWIIPAALKEKAVVIIGGGELFVVGMFLLTWRGSRDGEGGAQSALLRAVASVLVLAFGGFSAPARSAMLATASMSGRLDAVTFLLNYGTDINAQVAGLTPLMLASAEGHDAVVETLIKRGADVTVKGRDGLSALVMARGAEHPSTEKILISFGATE